MTTQKININLPIKNNGGVIKSEGDFTGLSPIDKSYIPEPEHSAGKMVSYLTSPPFVTLDIANTNNEAYRGQLVYYVESLSGISRLTQRPSLVTTNRSVFVMNTGALTNNVGIMYYFIGSPQKYEQTYPVFSPMPELNETGYIVNEFSYTYGGLQYKITQDGLSLVTLNNNMVGSGGLYMRNAAAQFRQSEGTELFTNTRSESAISSFYSSTVNGLISSKNLVQYYIGTNFTRAVVTHTYSNNVTVYYEYKFSQDEVIVQALVENNSTANISVPSLGGLNLFFDRVPEGVYTQGEGTGEDAPPFVGPMNLAIKDYQLMEPGFIGNNRELLITMAYAKDNTYSFCASPNKSGPHRQSFYLSDYQSSREDSKTRKVLEYHRHTPVRSLSSQGLKLKLKFGTGSWQNMITPYKEDMLYCHSGIRYTVDDWRMLLQSTIDNNRDGFGASNPFSFQENSRIDSSGGTVAYLNNLRSTYGSGLGANIFWSLEGRNPNEGEYRMEHDVWPPQVEETLTKQIIPFHSGNTSYGRLINTRNFNAQKHYEGVIRQTFSGANQVQPVPMKLYLSTDTITGSGVTSNLKRTVDNLVDAGVYGKLRYTVTGVFPTSANIALQYNTGNEWTTQTTITGVAINVIRTLPTSSDGFLRAKYRFNAVNWTGTGNLSCRLHTHQSSDNTFNVLISPKYTAYSGNLLLQYKDLLGTGWITKDVFKGDILTNSGQVSYFSGIPNRTCFVTYTTPSGWRGKLTLQPFVSGGWATGTEIRNRDAAATELSSIYQSISLTSGINQYRIISQNTWLTQANIIWGYAKSIDTNGLTIDILPTDWRFSTDNTFSGVAYVGMYEDNMPDILNYPAQLTRTAIGVDFHNQLARYKARFENVFRKGMNYFYGDTMGRFYDDFLILRELKREYPHNWHCLNEYHIDYTMPYAGTYSTAQLGNSPLGTRQSKTFATSGTYDAPYPVFINPLFYVSIGSFTGNIVLQNKIGGAWTNIKTYSGAILDEVESNQSYLYNRPWRLVAESGIVGSPATVMYDCINTTNGVMRYDEDNIQARYTVTNSGQYCQGLLYRSGTVVVHLNGSSWSAGTLHIQKYNNGWQTVESFTSIPTIPYKEYTITQDESWRYLSSGTWTGTLYIDMGQWRSRCSEYFRNIMNEVLGQTEHGVKMGSDMPSSLAGSFYNWAYRNYLKPFVVAGYESSGVAIQSQYMNNQGIRW